MSESWDIYVKAEQAAFEAAAAVLEAYGIPTLREVANQAEEAESDIEQVVRMMLGQKDVPEAWDIPCLI